MYRKFSITKTNLKLNEAYQAESIEDKMKRVLNNKEPITDGAEEIYTERKDGVNPALDIRHDRWETAIEATDKNTKSEIAKRNQNIGERTYDTMTDDQKSEFHTNYPNSRIKPPGADK